MRCMRSLFMHVIVVARVSDEIPQEFKINKNIGNTTSNMHVQYAKRGNSSNQKANNNPDNNSYKNNRNG